MCPVTAQYTGESEDALAVWYSTIWIFCPLTVVVLARSAQDILAGITARFAISELPWAVRVGTFATSEPAPLTLRRAALNVAALAARDAVCWPYAGAASARPVQITATAVMTPRADVRLTDRFRRRRKSIAYCSFRCRWTCSPAVGPKVRNCASALFNFLSLGWLLARGALSFRSVGLEILSYPERTGCYPPRSPSTSQWLGSLAGWPGGAGPSGRGCAGHRPRIRWSGS